MLNPELWRTIGPHLTAIAIAILGVISQVLLRRSDDERRKQDRAAEDTRFEQQRAADETRWSDQREAEEKRLADEHLRVMEIRRHDAAEEAAREHAERMRAEAVDFLSVLGEAMAAARKVSESLTWWAQKNDWEKLGESFKPWVGNDLPRRLAVAAGRVDLFLERGVAQDMHDDIISAIDSMRAAYRDKRQAPDPADLSLLEDFRRSFTSQVQADLKASMEAPTVAGRSD